MKVLEKLILIRDDIESIKDFRYDDGICYNIKTCDDRDNIALYSLFKEWPEFSGDTEFPVPGYKVDDLEENETDEERAYMETECEDMWNPGNPYGAARLRLVDFLISKLSK
uniref:Uncharacterized protein n=1 Tax=Rhizobium phage IG49 TaxID=3129228 RepID=A0AAU8HY79_9CAUD